VIRWLLLLGAALAVLVLVVWVTGLLLPVAHVASRTATFSAPTDAVYRTIADRDRYVEWWDDDTPTRVVDSDPPTRFVTRIADGLPFGGTWTFEVAPEGSGSRLTITERGEVYNPIYRVMSRYVFGQTATMDRFLGALARRLSTAGSAAKQTTQ
jgi:hypothetical protein